MTEVIETGAKMAVHVHRLLGEAIVAGDFDGTGLPNEAELSQRYGASRTVIREAIRMLMGKGLISMRQRADRIQPLAAWNLLDPEISYWLRKRPFSLETFREFIQMRLAVEPVAAGLTAARGDARVIQSLQSHLTTLLSSPPQSEDRLNAAIQFHQTIVLESGNAFFTRLLALISTALHMEFSHVSPGPLTASFQEQIMTCIAQADAAGAEALMRELLRATLRQVEAVAATPAED